MGDGVFFHPRCLQLTKTTTKSRGKQEEEEKKKEGVKMCVPVCECGESMARFELAADVSSGRSTGEKVGALDTGVALSVLSLRIS